MRWPNTRCSDEGMRGTLADKLKLKAGVAMKHLLILVLKCRPETEGETHVMNIYE